MTVCSLFHSPLLLDTSPAVQLSNALLLHSQVIQYLPSASPARGALSSKSCAAPTGRSLPISIPCTSSSYCSDVVRPGNIFVAPHLIFARVHQLTATNFQIVPQHLLHKRSQAIQNVRLFAPDRSTRIVRSARLPTSPDGLSPVSDSIRCTFPHNPIFAFHEAR